MFIVLSLVLVGVGVLTGVLGIRKSDKEHASYMEACKKRHAKLVETGVLYAKLKDVLDDEYTVIVAENIANSIK